MADLLPGNAVCGLLAHCAAPDNDDTSNSNNNPFSTHHSNSKYLDIHGAISLLVGSLSWEKSSQAIKMTCKALGNLLYYISNLFTSGRGLGGVGGVAGAGGGGYAENLQYCLLIANAMLRVLQPDSYWLVKGQVSR